MKYFWEIQKIGPKGNFQAKSGHFLAPRTLPDFLISKTKKSREKPIDASEVKSREYTTFFLEQRNEYLGRDGR